MTETVTGNYLITAKGTAVADQLWAMANDGKSLLEMGQELARLAPTMEILSAEGLMQAVVFVLAASVGVSLSLQ